MLFEDLKHILNDPRYGKVLVNAGIMMLTDSAITRFSNRSGFVPKL